MQSDKVIPVKVALRIRPLVPKEITEASTECLRTLGVSPQVRKLYIINFIFFIVILKGCFRKRYTF
jgi:hypothetical protein